jgi:hypothetical protein
MIDKKFSKSYDDCLQQAYLFHDGFVADEPDFTAASPVFASPFAADFLSDIVAADNLPTNDDDLNEQTLLTQAVEGTMETAREHFQKLLLYVSLAWPDDNAIAKAFGKTIYRKARSSALKMINLLQNSYSDANSAAYKTQLIAVGFVQADIDLLDATADELTAKNREQEKFMRLSFNRSEARVTAFNKVWDTMAKISDTSKVIYKSSPAKIEYYLLYPASGEKLPGKVQGMAYDMPTHIVSWSSAPRAIEYILERRLSGETAWLKLYDGPDKSFADLPPGPGTWLYRCRAHNDDGNGPWSDELPVAILA